MLCRIFVWGEVDSNRWIHLVNWNTISLPKEFGGLAIPRIQDFNNVVLAKLDWRLATTNGNLWVEIMKAKTEKAIPTDFLFC